MRPEASTAGSPTYAGWWQQQPPLVSDQELADITARAAAIGIPAWRVHLALGVAPADDGPPPQANPPSG